MATLAFLSSRLRAVLGTSASTLFLVRIAGLAASTGLGLGIAKWLGTDASGMYYLFLSGVLGGGLLARRGLDAVTLKHIAITNSEGATGQSLGQWFYCCGKAFLNSLVVIGVGIVCWMLLPGAVLKNVPTGIAWCVAIAVPFHAMHAVNIGALRGVGRQIHAALLEILAVPLVVILFIIISLALDNADEYTAIIYYTFGIAITFLAGTCNLWLLFRGATMVWPEVQALKSVSTSFFAVGFSAFVIDWSATYVLMAFTDIESIGIYNTCFRIVAVGGLVLTIFNNLHAPDFAVAFKNGDRSKVADVARTGSQACFLVGCTILVPVFCFPDLVLGFIGEDFLAGVPLLRMMVGAQLVNMFTGSVGYLLLMSGNEKVLERVSYTCLVLQIGVLVPAVYWFGMYGAAATWSTVGVFRNLVCMYFVKQKTGVLVIPAFLYMGGIRSGKAD